MNTPKVTKATPTATPGSSKKENVHPSVEKTTGYLDGEEAEVVASLKARKHVPLPFHLVDDFGRYGTSSENGDKLLQYLRKAFPTVTEMTITAPFLIVVCTQIPSSRLPFTIGGQPTIFTTEKTWDLYYDLGIPAKKRRSIVTSLNFHSKDKVTDETIQAIAEELQQLHLHPTEIGYMGGFLRLVFHHSVDPTDIPYRIAGCTVFLQFRSATAVRRMKLPIGTDIDTNEFFESDEGAASGLIPCGFAHDIIPGDNLEMDNPFNGSCAASVIGNNFIFQGTKYHEHKWIVFERGTRLRDGCCGSPMWMKMDGSAAHLQCKIV